MEKISFVWTIILGLIIGIGANILTPYIRTFFGRVSASVRYRNERKKEVFDKTVQYLIENPNDEVNLRIEKNFYYTIATVALVAALIVAVISRDVVEMGIAIGMLAVALYWIIVGMKDNRLVAATWSRRKKEGLGIDLD